MLNHSSILNELQLPMNRLDNFGIKNFGHVTRHNSLEKIIMQGMVAGKRSRGKAIQTWEKYITDTFGTMAAASRVAEDRHQFHRDIWVATSWRGYAPRRTWLQQCIIIYISVDKGLKKTTNHNDLTTFNNI